MNLITVMRMQLQQMETWYKNALITNVILDYLDLETPDAQRNVELITDLISSGRVVSLLEGTKDPADVYYVDKIKVLSIFHTDTEVVGGKCEPRKECRVDIRWRFQIEWAEKPKAVQETQDAIAGSDGKIVLLDTKR